MLDPIAQSKKPCCSVLAGPLKIKVKVTFIVARMRDLSWIQRIAA